MHSAIAVAWLHITQIIARIKMICTPVQYPEDIATPIFQCIHMQLCTYIEFYNRYFGEPQSKGLCV